jgi:hypothetical protein
MFSFENLLRSVYEKILLLRATIFRGDYPQSGMLVRQTVINVSDMLYRLKIHLARLKYIRGTKRLPISRYFSAAI